jgi:hypothetical protein
MQGLQDKRGRQSQPAYVKSAVVKEIENLLVREAVLIAIGAHEQAICHRLALGLEPWFDTFNIDCEYNRMESKIKRVILDRKKRIVKPDILVHERLYNDNLLAVEAKATSNPEWEDEPLKLIALTEDRDFSYRFGLWLVFFNRKEEILANSIILARGVWYEDGKETDRFERSCRVEDHTLTWVHARER